MSWDQRALLIFVSAPVILGWLATELTHAIFPPRGCAIHRRERLVVEAGGDDMPTIHGRTYCPKCQTALMAALDGAA